MSDIIECKYRMMLKEKDRACIKHKCQHYQTVFGSDPQTGEVMEHHMCSDLLANKVRIEGNKLQNESGAAVESLRNEMVRLSSKPQLIKKAN